MDMSALLTSFAQCQPRNMTPDISLDTVKRTGLPWTGCPESLCLAMNASYLTTALKNPCVAGVTIPPELEARTKGVDKLVLVATAAEELFCLLHNSGLHRIYGRTDAMVAHFVSPQAHIHPSAVLAEHVHIADGVVIGPYAVIGENTVIGPETFVGSQSVIGEDGLYGRRLEGRKTHVRHFGGVRIGSGCRIGAQSVVARAVYHDEYTSIGDEVFLAFQVTIGHDCVLESGSDISSHATLGGRTHMEKNCWVGIGANISNTRHIGEGASIMMGAALIDDVPAGGKVSGNFAISHVKNLKNKVLQS